MTAAPLTRGQVWVAAVLVAFLAVQLALPVIGLYGARPARFGWQMYSVAQAAPQAWAEGTDGALTRIDLAGRLAVLRADTRDTNAIGRALCAGGSYAAVVIHFADEPMERVPCS